jgi:hypothetical protein
MTFTFNNEIYEEAYNENGEVYGCDDSTEEFLECSQCGLTECPMRGNKR